MKQTILLTLILLFSACNTNNKKSTETESKEDIVEAFLNDVSSLEKTEAKNPIIAFQELAKVKAKKAITIDKEHISEALEAAKKYKHCVITTGNHTIIKVGNMEDSKVSGAWGVKMPMCKGYIKKGELTAKEDYANNLIGIPDNQDRIAYYFD